MTWRPPSVTTDGAGRSTAAALLGAAVDYRTAIAASVPLGFRDCPVDERQLLLGKPTLGVPLRTFQRWRNEQPEFTEAIGAVDAELFQALTVLPALRAALKDDPPQLEGEAREGNLRLRLNLAARMWPASGFSAPAAASPLCTGRQLSRGCSLPPARKAWCVPIRRNGLRLRQDAY
jgi:hypothetical protein